MFVGTITDGNKFYLCLPRTVPMPCALPYEHMVLAEYKVRQSIVSFTFQSDFGDVVSHVMGNYIFMCMCIYTVQNI